MHTCDSNFETIWGQVHKPGNKKLIIAVIYRPPGDSLSICFTQIRKALDSCFDTPAYYGADVLNERSRLFISNVRSADGRFTTQQWEGCFALSEFHSALSLVTSQIWRCCCAVTMNQFPNV